MGEVVDERFRRHDLSDEEWARLEPLLPVHPRQGHRWSDHRIVIDGVFHRVRVGDPWRDLPERFGLWQTVYNRHRRWPGDGTWETILTALMAGCDEAEGPGWTVAIDSTVVRVHQHAAGARHAPPKDIDPDRLRLSALRPVLSRAEATGRPEGCHRGRNRMTRIRRPQTQTGPSRTASGLAARHAAAIGRVWVVPEAA